MKKSKIICKIASVVAIVAVLLSVVVVSSSAYSLSQLPYTEYDSSYGNFNFSYTPLADGVFNDEDTFFNTSYDNRPLLTHYLDYLVISSEISGVSSHSYFGSFAYRSYNYISSELWYMDFMSKGFYSLGVAYGNDLYSSGLAFSPSVTFPDLKCYTDTFLLNDNKYEDCLWMTVVVPSVWDVSDSYDVDNTSLSWWFTFEYLVDGEFGYEWVNETVEYSIPLNDTYLTPVYIQDDITRPHYDFANSGLSVRSLYIPIREVLARYVSLFEIPTEDALSAVFVKNLSFSPVMKYGLNDEYYWDEIWGETYEIYGQTAAQNIMQFEEVTKTDGGALIGDGYVDSRVIATSFCNVGFWSSDEFLTRDDYSSYWLSRITNEVVTVDFSAFNFVEWIGDTLGVIFDIDLIGPISLSDILLVVVGVFVVIMVLRIFAGG